MVKELSDGVTETQILQNFERNSHWRMLSIIMVWERYCNASLKPEFFLFALFGFGLTFLRMILHTETSKLIYNSSFLFFVLHKPTLLPSTFKLYCIG